MSAYSIKYNKTLATEFIDSKTNEIPTCPKLLARLNIKDTIITFDALNTQEKKYLIYIKIKHITLFQLKIITKIFQKNYQHIFMIKDY